MNPVVARALLLHRILTTKQGMTLLELERYLDSQRSLQEAEVTRAYVDFGWLEYCPRVPHQPPHAEPQRLYELGAE